VYSVGTYEQSLVFYLGRTVTLVAFEDEFAFGLKQQPQLWIPDMAEFVRRWRSDTAAGRRSVAIIRPEFVPALQRDGVPLRLLASDTRRALIASP